MKRIILFILIFILLVTTVEGITGDTCPYKGYSKVIKKVNELEWRLVQVNLKLSSIDYFVYFDNYANLFKVDKFVNKYFLKETQTSTLRYSLLSECDLVVAAIGFSFPEFRDRGENELIVKYFIGEKSSRHFATYDRGNLSFNDAYYGFLKEHDR